MLATACGPAVGLSGEAADGSTSSGASTTHTSAPSASITDTNASTSGTTAITTGVDTTSDSTTSDADSGTTSDAAAPCESEEAGTWGPIADAPESRQQATAIYTGEEVIVWAGMDETDELAVGALRYHVADDAWSLASVVGEPTARTGNVAVWTGDEMIVWGGSILVDQNAPTFEFLDDGGRYDPVTDTWQPLSTTNAPIARIFHKAVWTGQHVVILGGGNYNREPIMIDEGGVFDPATDTWSRMTLAGAPVARYDFAMAWTGSEVFVWGGYGVVGPEMWGAAEGGALYDPVTDSWRPITQEGAPAPAIVVDAAWTGDEVLLYGSDVVARYDPEADVWLEVAQICDVRWRPNVVWTGGSMLVWGGTRARQRPCGFDCQEEFAPEVVRVGVDASMLIAAPDGGPGPRSGPAIVWTAGGLVVWGGSAPHENTYGAVASGAIYAPDG